jgi:hypothetical protein
MCKVLKQTKRKKVTGYKVVIKKNKKYYSPMTGIEYITNKKVTPVKTLEDYNKYEHNRTNSDFLAPFSWLLNDGFLRTLYQKSAEGKTAIFKTKKDLHARYPDIDEDLVIIKMTLSRNICEGYYNGGTTGSSVNVFMGEFIESIEEIK